MRYQLTQYLALAVAAVMFACPIAAAQEPTNADQSRSLKALIVDGQNNHGNWPTTTEMMRRYR